MGLLRKAAVTAGRGESGGEEQASAPAESDQARGPGLLKRSIKALEAGIQALPLQAEEISLSAPAPVEALEEPSPAALAIELAEKDAETGVQPIQFESRTLTAEPE